VAYFHTLHALNSARIQKTNFDALSEFEKAAAFDGPPAVCHTEYILSV
jgi:hypothetical protein